MTTIAVEDLIISTILTFCENAAELGCPQDKEVDMWFRELEYEDAVVVAEKMCKIQERNEAKQGNCPHHHLFGVDHDQYRVCSSGCSDVFFTECHDAYNKIIVEPAHKAAKKESETPTTICPHDLVFGLDFERDQVCWQRCEPRFYNDCLCAYKEILDPIHEENVQRIKAEIKAELNQCPHGSTFGKDHEKYNNCGDVCKEELHQECKEVFESSKPPICIKPPVCTIKCPPNELGMMCIHGNAVESGGITDDNVAEIIKKLVPIVKLAREAVLKEIKKPLILRDFEDGQEYTNEKTVLTKQRRNEGWVYFNDLNFDEFEFEGKVYNGFFIVSKEWWGSHGYLEQDSYYRGINEGSLIFPPHCGEYIENGIEVPGTVEEGSKLLEEWGFEPANMSYLNFEW